MRGLGILVGAAVFAMTSASPAVAQKSQDTLRIAIIDQFPTLLRYHGGVDESSVFSRRVFDELIGFDEHTQKVIPQLAKAGKQIDPTT
jgi:ABC-type transport system substrate-binding protein